MPDPQHPKIAQHLTSLSAATSRRKLATGPEQVGGASAKATPLPRVATLVRRD
jgi:hypothetical protein